MAGSIGSGEVKKKKKLVRCLKEAKRAHQKKKKKRSESQKNQLCKSIAAGEEKMGRAEDGVDGEETGEEMTD